MNTISILFKASLVCFLGLLLLSSAYATSKKAQPPKNLMQNCKTVLAKINKSSRLSGKDNSISKPKRIYEQRKNLHESLDFKEEFENGPVVASNSSYYDDDTSRLSNDSLYTPDDFQSEYKDGPVRATEERREEDSSYSSSSSSYFPGSNIGPSFDGNPSGSDWNNDHGYNY